MGTRDFYPPRQSRFVEGSMNDRSGPRSRFWDDHKFDFTFEKNPKATTVTEVPITYDGAEQGAAPSGEGIFGRFSRAATALFRRKKEPQPPAEPPRDTRKEEAERAYHEAKRLGLLPEAKVFVRPGMRAYTAPVTGSPRTPRRTPTTTKKQAQLQKRVERLEHNLFPTREKLSDTFPPHTPQLNAPPNSVASSPWTDSTRFSADRHSSGKISKRRRIDGPSAEDTPESSYSYKPSATDLASDTEDDLAEFGSMKRKAPGGTAQMQTYIGPQTTSPANDYTDWRSPSANQALKRVSSGLQAPSKRIRCVPSSPQKGSRTTVPEQWQPREDVVMRDAGEQEAFMVVPDGLHVPPIPSIPYRVEGRRAQVSSNNLRRDDGFGGLGHEIF